MSDKSRRKQLTEAYKRNRPDAGVYRVTNTATGRILIGSALNLASVKSKLDFARATRSTGAFAALDHRLASDLRQYGLDAFTLEILEVLDAHADMTDAEVRDDLTALEALWRE